MNLAAYKLLNQDKQFQIIKDQGVFLAEREDAYYNIRLYGIEGFYVEIYCHTHFNVIVKTKSFFNTKALAPYLKHIPIYHLFA